MKRGSREKSLHTGGAYFVRLVDDGSFSDHAVRLTRARVQVGGLRNVDWSAALHDGHEILEQRGGGNSFSTDEGYGWEWFEVND